MIKVFSTGVFLGLILAGLAAFFVPVSDLQRETSLVVVKPNGGVIESFKIRIPEDRIIASASAGGAATPGNLKWPPALSAAGSDLEVFKLRNEKGIVVGLASRVVGSIAHESGTSISAIEWVLHLPARGSLYFPMDSEVSADGYRMGQMRAGTREFFDLVGTISESFIAAGDGNGEIALQTIVVAKQTEDIEGALE